MQKRERILLLTAAAAAVLFIGFRLIGVFWGPITESRQRLDSLNEELTLKTKDAEDIKAAGVQLRRLRSRSLPPNPFDAQRLYQVWLTDLAQMSDIREAKVTPGRRIPKGKVYTAVLVTVEGKATLANLSKFLYFFYRIDLPHRITSMSIDSPGNSGDPSLQISLTAEGLVLSGAQARKQLFPQSRLQNRFRSESGEQTLEVTDAAPFPQKPGFRIRIDNEYLMVTKMSRNKWTVRGGVDSTRTGTHDTDALVELAPIHSQYADLTLDDFQSLVDNSPFTKPAPSRDRRPTQIATTDNGPGEIYLGGIVNAEAWLYRRLTLERTVVRKGSTVELDDDQLVVLDVNPDFILLQKDDDVWQLKMGKNLNWQSMQKMPPPINAAAPSPAIEDSEGDQSATPTIAPVPQ
jgi:hypothetical protein